MSRVVPDLAWPAAKQARAQMAGSLLLSPKPLNELRQTVAQFRGRVVTEEPPGFRNIGTR
jgi:hypothetical protein